MTTKTTTTTMMKMKMQMMMLRFSLWMFLLLGFGSLGVSAGLHELIATPETNLTLKR